MVDYAKGQHTWSAMVNATQVVGVTPDKNVKFDMTNMPKSYKVKLPKAEETKEKLLQMAVASFFEVWDGSTTGLSAIKAKYKDNSKAILVDFWTTSKPLDFNMMLQSIPKILRHLVRPVVPALVLEKLPKVRFLLPKASSQMQNRTALKMMVFDAMIPDVIWVQEEKKNAVDPISATIYATCGVCGAQMSECAFCDVNEVERFRTQFTEKEYHDFIDRSTGWCKEHASKPSHLKPALYYQLPLSSVMGPTGFGRGARHAINVGHRSPIGADVDGVFWTAPGYAGAPLPVKQCLRETLGCGELLIPATWELIKDGKVKMEVNKIPYTILAKDVESLELGVAFYASSGNTTGYKEEWCRWMPWSCCLDTAKEWLEAEGLSMPTRDNPSPEVKKYVKYNPGDKDPDFQTGGPMDRTPAFSDKGWYYVVKINFRKTGCKYWSAVSEVTMLICMQQIVTPVESAKTGTYIHWAWTIQQANVAITDTVMQSIQNLVATYGHTFPEGEFQAVVLESGSLDDDKDKDKTGPGGSSGSGASSSKL